MILYLEIASFKTFFGGTWKYFELDKIKYSLVWSNHVMSSNMKKKVKDKLYATM